MLRILFKKRGDKNGHPSFAICGIEKTAVVAFIKN